MRRLGLEFKWIGLQYLGLAPCIERQGMTRILMCPPHLTLSVSGSTNGQKIPSIMSLVSSDRWKSPHVTIKISANYVFLHIEKNVMYFWDLMLDIFHGLDLGVWCGDCKSFFNVSGSQYSWELANSPFFEWTLIGNFANRA